MTFQEWWSEHGTLDYDEMAISTDAWKYQQKRILELEYRIKQSDRYLKRANEQLRLCAESKHP